MQDATEIFSLLGIVLDDSQAGTVEDIQHNGKLFNNVLDIIARKVN